MDIIRQYLILKEFEARDERIESLIRSMNTAWRKQYNAMLIEILPELTSKTKKIDKPTLKRVKSVIDSNLREKFLARIESYVRLTLVQSYNSGKNSVRTVKKSDPEGLTAEELKELARLKYNFNAKDLRALDVLVKGFLEYLKKYHGKQVGAEIWAKMNDYFKHGMTNWELSKQLEDELKALMANRNEKYFRTLADTLTSKAGEYGRISGYEESQIQYMQIVAMLDDRTTSICRRMHGRIIPVKAAAKQRDQVLAAMEDGDYELANDLHRFVKTKNMDKLSGSTSGILASGVILPPYHFGCRTTTVAYFPPVGFEGYSRELGDHSKKYQERGSLSDLEIRNFLDELSKRIQKRSIIWTEGKLESHTYDHGPGFDLARDNTKGYEDMLYKVLSDYSQIILNWHRNNIVFGFVQKNRAVFIKEGFQFGTGYVDKEGSISQKIKEGEIVWQKERG